MLRGKIRAYRNKTFRNNEEKIHRAICHKMSERHFFVKTREICKEAGITKTTFYLHFANYFDARGVLEHKLMEQFADKLSHNYENKSFFSLLTEFVGKNKIYFCAAQKGSDHYLLTQILLNNRERLVSKSTSDRSFRLYVRHLQSIIDNWLEFDDVTPVTTTRCVRLLKTVRPVTYW